MEQKWQRFRHFKCLDMTTFQSLEASEILEFQTLHSTEIFQMFLCVCFLNNSFQSHLWLNFSRFHLQWIRLQDDSSLVWDNFYSWKFKLMLKSLRKDTDFSADYRTYIMKWSINSKNKISLDHLDIFATPEFQGWILCKGWTEKNFFPKSLF